MAVDHSACGSMKTGVKPEIVCELQDTNDHRQVERKWRLSALVDEPSVVEGRSLSICSTSDSAAAADISSTTQCHETVPLYPTHV